MRATSYNNTNDNTGSNNTSWIESVSKQILRQAMNEQQLLNHIHDQIYDVSYISDDSNGDTSESSVQTTIPRIETPIVPTTSPHMNNSNRGNNDFRIWTWIFFPLGLVLMGILIYELYRYLQRRRRAFSDRNSIRDDSAQGGPSVSGGSFHSLMSRQQQQKQSGTMTVIEYGPFSGRFPYHNDVVRSTGSDNAPSKTYLPVVHREYDDDHVVSDYVDTTINMDRLERENHASLRDDNLPICDFDGLDVNNTSYDTEMYYNSIASSSDHDSSNDTKELSAARGQFPSTVEFIT
jgi:hypothetical protein